MIRRVAASSTPCRPHKLVLQTWSLQHQRRGFFFRPSPSPPGVQEKREQEVQSVSQTNSANVGVNRTGNVSGVSHTVTVAVGNETENVRDDGAPQSQSGDHRLQQLEQDIVALKQQNESLRTLLRQRTETIASLTCSGGGPLSGLATASTPLRSPSGPARGADGATVVVNVHTNDELDDILSKVNEYPLVRIILSPSSSSLSSFQLYCCHKIRGPRRVEIIGGGGGGYRVPSDGAMDVLSIESGDDAQEGKATTTTTLHGSLEVSDGAEVFLTNLDITAAAPIHSTSSGVDGRCTTTNRDQHQRTTSSSSSCVAVSGASTMVSLSHCILRDGRDGIYVSGRGKCYLDHCTISNNIRGVFESFKCYVFGTGCRFLDNHYHCVLLGSSSSPSTIPKTGTTNKPPRSRGPQDLYERFPVGCNDTSSSATTSIYCYFDGASNPHCKGDVCFGYNPVEDVYSDVYKNGTLVIVTPACSSEGLGQNPH